MKDEEIKVGEREKLSEGILGCWLKIYVQHRQGKVGRHGSQLWLERFARKLRGYCHCQIPDDVESERKRTTDRREAY